MESVEGAGDQKGLVQDLPFCKTQDSLLVSFITKYRIIPIKRPCPNKRINGCYIAAEESWRDHKLIEVHA